MPTSRRSDGLQVVTGGIGSRAARAIIVANRATRWQQQEAADGDDLAFRSDTPQVPAESRRGSGSRSAHHLRPHDRSDANAICEFLGRELYGRPGCRVLQALHRGDRHPDPHGNTGGIRQDQSAGAEPHLRVRHDVGQLHAMAAGEPRGPGGADRLDYRQQGCAAFECRRRRWVRYRAKYSGNGALLPHRQISRRGAPLVGGLLGR